jgi:NAD(P)-dependent dehydrogenase (short-subunit alcohol dehydrogenase family)
MDLKLAGKVVLITGSSRGIGLATAKAFLAEGCRIMLSARSASQLRRWKPHCGAPVPQWQLMPGTSETPPMQLG